MGKALPAVLEFCLGLSGRLQPKALSTSSESICSAELRHSELPSGGQKKVASLRIGTLGRPLREWWVVPLETEWNIREMGFCEFF